MIVLPCHLQRRAIATFNKINKNTLAVYTSERNGLNAQIFNLPWIFGSASLDRGSATMSLCALCTAAFSAVPYSPPEIKLGPLILWFEKRNRLTNSIWVCLVLQKNLDLSYVPDVGGSLQCCPYLPPEVVVIFPDQKYRIEF
jgi:hypothetical protein